MSYLHEKVSYLKGLAEGMEVEQNSKEGKLLVHIIDVLDDFAAAFDELDTDLEELEEYVEDVDEDLADLEDYVESVDEDLADLEDEIEMELGLEDYDEFECPHCGEAVMVDQDWDDEDCCVELTCSECGEDFVISDMCCCEEVTLEQDEITEE